MARQLKSKESKEFFPLDSVRDLRVRRYRTSHKTKTFLTPAEQAEAAAAHKVKVGTRGMIAILTRQANA